MPKETIFALAVSLITWGGVWVYLLRLDRLTRALERQARDINEREVEPESWAESGADGAALREEAGR